MAVGDSILGAFQAVQGSALNRERIAGARATREKAQLELRKAEDLDAHGTIIKSGTRNGYINAREGFSLNSDKLISDLNSTDANTRMQAEDFSLSIMNRSNKKDQFTATGLQLDPKTNKFAFVGRNADGSLAPVTDNGTSDPNDVVSQFDADEIASAIGVVYRGRVLPRSNVDPVIYEQYKPLAAAMDAAEATGDHTATRGVIRVLGSAADDAEANDVANKITTDLGGAAPDASVPTTEPEPEVEAEPLLLNATTEQQRDIRRLRGMISRAEKNTATQTNPRYAKRLEEQKAELAALEAAANETPIGRLEGQDQRQYNSLNKRIASLNKTLEGKDTSKGIAATQAATLSKLTSERDALVGKARELANPPAPEVSAVANKVTEATGGDETKIGENIDNINVSQSEAAAVAASAQAAGVRTPADIVKLGPQQRAALIASVVAYAPESQRNQVFNSFVNYLDTGNPNTSGKDLLTAQTSARRLNFEMQNKARSNADALTDNIQEVNTLYTQPIIRGTWNEEDREFIAPTQDAIEAATQLRNLAASAKFGGSSGLAAANQYLNSIMPLLIAEGKQTGDGFFGRIADIFRDDARLQVGNMADLIVVEYDGKDPIRLKFKDPAGGLLEEELTWKELAKVTDSATRNAISLAYKKRLEAESKKQ